MTLARTAEPVTISVSEAGLSFNDAVLPIPLDASGLAAFLKKPTRVVPGESPFAVGDAHIYDDLGLCFLRSYKTELIKSLQIIFRRGMDDLVPPRLAPLMFFRGMLGFPRGVLTEESTLEDAVRILAGLKHRIGGWWGTRLGSFDITVEIGHDCESADNINKAKILNVEICF